MKRLYPEPPKPNYRFRGKKFYKLFPDRRIGNKRDPFRFDLWEAKQIFWETLRVFD